MPPRILIVEDDHELAGLTAAFFQENGFTPSVESRGDTAIATILREQPDVVLLDLNLPGRSGFEVCRAVRRDWGGALVVLTARRDEVDEVVALELGADDYMAKPVRARALLARIQGLLRRPAPAAGRVTLGRLTVDGRTRTVELEGRPVDLTTAEFDLLWALVERRNTVVEREELHRVLRGFAWDGLDRSIDLRVSRLRRRLGDTGRPPTLIRSVRGTGYLLAAP